METNGDSMEPEQKKQKTVDGTEPTTCQHEVIQLPRKRFYRQRAHSNPLAYHDFDYPESPDTMDWYTLYPRRNEGDPQPKVEFLDVGCGYGGLLGVRKTWEDEGIQVTLSPLYPEIYMLGMEIRVKVSNYVRDKIKALRSQHPGQYNNIACIRSNAMTLLPCFFKKHQLSKMFFLYPDPHFKKSKHKWRIISPTLLTEYSNVLRPGGILYTITDVEQVYEWNIKHLREHALFEELTQEELDKDPIVPYIYDSSEEGKKVSRNNGSKFLAVFRRKDDSDVSDTLSV